MKAIILESDNSSDIRLLVELAKKLNWYRRLSRC